VPSKKKPGLYANIHAKQERIRHGSGEKMRQPGEEGAPTAQAFRDAAKTAKATKSAKGAKGGKRTAAKASSGSSRKPSSK
jgi:hypothetical protein